MATQKSRDDRIPPQPEVELRDNMFLTFEEAAAHIRQSPNAVRRYVDAGLLPATRPRGVKRRTIIGRDLHEFMMSGRYKG